MLKLDCHVHTNFSKDSLLNLQDILDIADKKGINGLIITDHNQTKGALKLKKMSSKIKIIIGEEIMTQKGEVIGLFLKKRISPGMTIEKTINNIKKQGGLVYIPHPFDRMRSSAIGDQNIKKIKNKVDIIEVFNSRNIFPEDNKKANKFANKFNLLKAVGSDAHIHWEVGNSYVKMKDFNNSIEFKKNLKKGKLITNKSNILVHGLTKTVKIFGGLFNGGKFGREVS